MTFSYSLQQIFPSAEHCPDCRARLERALRELPGVIVGRLEGTELRLQATRDPQAELSRAIERIRAQHAHETFRVEGMDCASCTRTVEGALRRLPGVSVQRINFVSERLEVAYDPRTVNPEDLGAMVEPLGYKLRLERSRVPIGVPGLPDPQEGAWHTTRQGRALILAGTLLALAWSFGHLEPQLSQWGYIAATLVGGGPFALKAYRAARVGNPFSINTLVSVAAGGAILIGEAAEAAVVVFLFAVGELLEGVAAGRARAGIRALAALAPKTALLIHEEDPGETQTDPAAGLRVPGKGFHTHEIPVERLEVGQKVLIQPGGRVPADGTILSGFSALDESPITGESLPVNKGPGDAVFAGSLNTDGVLTVRVDRSAQDNTIARILHLVEEAQESKAPTQRFIDRFSRFYTPAVMLLSLLVALVPPLLVGGWQEWVYKGLALLLIGCPCALLVSVPAAITSGISAGARRGLLIKGGAALEALGRVRTVAFDKTGTLTLGRPKVSDLIGLGVSQAELLAKAAAVEQGSSHPLAKAILERAAVDGVSVPASSDQRAVRGKAAMAELEGQTYAVGSPRYAAELAPLPDELRRLIERLERQGKTVVLLLRGATPLGLIALRDEAKAEAKQALDELGALGLRRVMLTGDNRRAAESIAGELGLEVRAELLPQDKFRAVGELRRGGGVAMVGDGINDAPALALADVGIAMGSGSDVALESADAALLHNSVRGVVDLIRLSRATLSNIRLNIAIALGLKAAFLLSTLLGVTNLWMAILADTGATVLVTANALRLLRFRSDAHSS
ncbi:heavy metal translocating P-type ATPase [Calidithermus timidus]|jgi:Cd2+/Zn2+-exporting ATPase|uniref:heavy metal translocating P-type ATPase n=1 Tax=Calidithermus timidus TaxID=307124 RepID=UPI00039B0213|nr:heavy metal translocating P-type ATPase [Calidithermus timidus]